MAHKLGKSAFWDPPKLNERGQEVPDPAPVAIPAGFARPESMAETIQRLVRGSVSRAAREQGLETFEEAEDFDLDDEEDDDRSSPYETHFDPVLGKDLSPQEFRDYEVHYRRQYLAAQRAYFESLDRTRVMERAARGPRDPAEAGSPTRQAQPAPAPGGSESDPPAPGKGKI